MTNEKQYYYLKKGELIQEGDNYKMYGGRFTVMFDSILLQWVGFILLVLPVPVCNMKNPKIVNHNAS